MFKGFYNLTSGMVSQGRRLDIIANNMTNVSTTGYRQDAYTDRTFGEFVRSRIGNQDKRNAAELGQESYILAPDQIYTDYTQGSLRETNSPLDFAIEGDGFFAVQTDNGIVYTRNGSFTLDNEGYLCLGDLGRVLNDNEEPMVLLTDKIRSDKFGGIYMEEGGYLGKIGVFTFADNGALARDERGNFIGGGQAAAVNVPMHQKMLERSNVELAKEMTEMLSTQRALQSAAQVSKMYDQVMTKATSDIGRL